MIHLFALLGVLSISFSAVFIRLASVSPVTAAFYRAIYAIPVLAPLWLVWRARDGRTAAARGVAFASGLVLAADLAFWHESIALVGAGLGTVIANVQVVFIAAIGWAFFDERPTPRTWLVIAGILAGVGLTSGLARPDAYGAAPMLGVVFGLLAGLCYSGFLLIFRAANRTTSVRAGPLLDSTCGMAIGALLVTPLDRGFSFVPTWPAHGWLVLLAIVAQVIGWLLISTALTQLPPLETSILLLVQPVFALVWGKLFFDEHLSAIQWLGTALVLGGVAMTSGGRLTRDVSPDRPGAQGSGLSGAAAHDAGS